MPLPATQLFPVERHSLAGGVEQRDDPLATEEPLELRVNGRSVAVVMRTPGHDRELAAGFLATEGVIRDARDILDIVPCEFQRAADSTDSAPPPTGNVWDVLLAPHVTFDLARLTRHVFTSSSCGLCGKATIDAVRAEFPPQPPSPPPSAALLSTLPARLRAAQPGFSLTGGLHASGLFDLAGQLLVAREDVGRHNALDKVVGHALLASQLPLAGRILLVSGRVSFELVQKSLAAGIPCLAAISAPTTAAVALARETGQTLVGFLRDGRMNVYAGTLTP
ncbi:formate dehydrogenase accessory sulfurtransferase FdhD [Horticoccus luteus]|uniref:Sulfur carrier protein FdhD n=1 Tax=Horticoccus luteus TaxID=2862869 RepID=A0A8F9TWE9_9BACT|nr:formate dehydrogenase accessory sulfurtransferase FdhD [Horticoccus luteus]QYM79251.1 formate dehydrogenase accessory sulfurtransferase FdhD [Horticoccus luteus]